MQMDKWKVMDNNFEYLNDILVKSDYDIHSCEGSNETYPQLILELNLSEKSEYIKLKLAECVCERPSQSEYL